MTSKAGCHAVATCNMKHRCWDCGLCGACVLKLPKWVFCCLRECSIFYWISCITLLCSKFNLHLLCHQNFVWLSWSYLPAGLGEWHYRWFHSACNIQAGPLPCLLHTQGWEPPHRHVWGPFQNPPGWLPLLRQTAGCSQTWWLCWYYQGLAGYVLTKCVGVCVCVCVCVRPCQTMLWDYI